MPNPFKSFGYIKCCSSNCPRPIKNPCNYVSYNCLKICSQLKRPETAFENPKKARCFEVIEKFMMYKFSKNLPTTERIKPSNNLENKIPSDIIKQPCFIRCYKQNLGGIKQQRYNLPLLRKILEVCIESQKPNFMEMLYFLVFSVEANLAALRNFL